MNDPLQEQFHQPMSQFLVISGTGDHFRQLRQHLESIFRVLIANLLELFVGESNFLDRLFAAGAPIGVDPRQPKDRLSQNEVASHRHLAEIDRLALEIQRIRRFRQTTGLEPVFPHRQCNVPGRDFSVPRDSQVGVRIPSENDCRAAR
jgi:hypothetical protein